MSKKLSKSPDRGSFQLNSMIKSNPNKLVDIMQIQVDIMERIKQQEADPAWSENNLEYDLLTTDWILTKARESRVYAQNLYAAICNNDFQKLDVWQILKDQTWGCSWRHAGGIIADMREQGDYIDWYCSGIQSEEDLIFQDNMTQEQIIAIVENRGFVAEGVVTDEISQDLKKLGWIVVTKD